MQEMAGYVYGIEKFDENCVVSDNTCFALSSSICKENNFNFDFLLCVGFF